MTITVKHKFVSAIPDEADATVVRPSNWNDDHDLVGTIPVANGGTGASDASTARTNLGLGTIATQNANSVAITGGNIDGTTIGATTQADITGNTINANTKVVSPDYYAQSILGGNLRTSGGTSLVNWDGAGSGNVTVNGGLNANPANKNVSIAPTGTGTATINPATTGAMDNMVIGATTPSTGAFTTLKASGNTLLAQSTDQGTGVLQVTGQSTFNGAVTDKSLNLQGGNNLVLNSATLVTQNITVTANTYTLSMTGTGTITLSGTSSGTLVGTGASQVVSKTFTPTAGTLTLTPTGSCTTVQLELGSVFSGYTATTGTAVTTTNNINVPSGGMTIANQILEGNGTNNLPSYSFSSFPTYGMYFDNTAGIAFTHSANVSFGTRTNFLAIPSTSSLGWTNGNLGGTLDTIITRDAANTLAQRNSTNAQTFRLYNSFTDSSNYERLGINWSSNTATIQTENAGTGTRRALAFGQDVTINTVTIGLGGGAVSTNTAVGNGAIANSTTGVYNTAVGNNTLRNISTASYTTAIGANALNLHQTGNNNAVFGLQGAYNSISCANLVSVGVNSLYNNTTASNLTAIGYQSLTNNTTNVATLGTITGGTGYTNGTYTGVVMTLSSGSTALTYPTATIVVSGGAVTSVTLTSNGVGFKDTTTVLTAPAASIGGTGSGFSVPVATLQSGTGNVAVGYQAGFTASVATNNTYNGYQAGYGITTGSNSVFMGYGSGNTTTVTTTGSQLVYIGSGSRGSAATNTNEIAIGYNAVGLGSNTTVLGNTSTTLTQTYGVTKSTNYTVATLPSASTSGVGARAFVTDALAPVFGATVVTGGAVATPVYSDSVNWKVG